MAVPPAAPDALEVSLDAPAGAATMHPGDGLQVRWRSRGADAHDVEASVEGVPVPIARALPAEARHLAWTIPADLLAGRVRIELRVRVLARAGAATAEATSDALAIVPRRVPTVPPPPSRAPQELALDSIDPKSGPATGGTTLTVHGRGFARFTIVRVGGRDASTTFVSPSLLTVHVPPTLAAGLADVVAIDPDTRTATLRHAFRYDPVPPPEVRALEPNHGALVGGTRVTIVGARFGPGTLVTVGGARPARTTYVDPSTLEIVTPARPHPGLVDVEVATVDGQTARARNAYRYDPVAPPELERVLPRQGPSRGGGRVTLLGRGFGAQSTVLFGAIAAPTVVFKSSGELEVEAPPSEPGIVDVRVDNADGQTAVARRAFQYV